MKVLVTGGAGYIGSHTVRLLLENKHEVIIVDNLVNGHKETIPKNAKFYEGDIGDKEFLTSVFKKNKIDAVIHFAAFIEAGDSMKRPERFYRNNVINSINLLEVMLEHNVKKIIYSSTAALFGNPKRVPIKEDDLKKPINVYGRTKLMIEEVLDDYETIHGLKSVRLRYFNASGAGFDIGENHHPETHLIPIVLQVALGKRKDIKIFGTDYETKDGTCIRDYIHVLDLARAHILALNIESGKYNLGCGEGYSVKEVINMCREVTGHPIPAIEEKRREGDPAILVADSSLIKEELGWKPKFGLKEIIQSAWNWHKNNPEGFA